MYVREKERERGGEGERARGRNYKIRNNESWLYRQPGPDLAEEHYPPRRGAQSYFVCMIRERSR